jgi:hypothetical protein
MNWQYYKKTSVQQLIVLQENISAGTDSDVERVESCRWFRDVIAAKEEDILDVAFFFFADEPSFHLSG